LKKQWSNIRTSRRITNRSGVSSDSKPRSPKRESAPHFKTYWRLKLIIRIITNGKIYLQ
jgi:hypothetical protein